MIKLLVTVKGPIACDGIEYVAGNGGIGIVLGLCWGTGFFGELACNHGVRSHLLLSYVLGCRSSSALSFESYELFEHNSRHWWSRSSWLGEAGMGSECAFRWWMVVCR